MESAVGGNSTTDRHTTIVIDFVAKLRSVEQHVKKWWYIMCPSITRAMMSEGKKSVCCLQ
jgi:hypothetical protein